MASFPVAPVLPEINTSANIALSRWNGMIQENQKQFAEYMATLVRQGQIGSSLCLEDDVAVIQGCIETQGKTKIKIGELVDSTWDDSISMSSSLFSNKILALCVYIVFEFDKEDGTVTASDGSVIPVEENFNSISNYDGSMEYKVIAFSDFDTAMNQLSGARDISTGNNDGYTYKRLAKREDSHSAYNVDALNVYVSGIDVSQDYITTVDSTVRFLLPFAILKTTDNWSNVDVIDSVVPYDADSSLTGMTQTWRLPYIVDQVVTGNSGFSAAKNNFDVDINGNIKTKSIGSLGDDSGPIIELADYSLQVTTPLELSGLLVNNNFVIEDCYNVTMINQGVVERSFLGTKNTSQYKLPPWLFFVRITDYNLGVASSDYYLLSVKKEHTNYLENVKLYGLETFAYPGGGSGFSQTSYVSGIYDDLIDSSNRYCPFKFNPSRGDLSSPGTAILFFPVYIRR